MAGTKAGGRKAAATNMAKYGRSFYRRIGSKGGQRDMEQFEKKKNMFGGLVMSSFRDRFGQLTVEQARELNEAARWYCGHEVTSEAQDEA